MGLADMFKATENEALKKRVRELEALLTPEMRNLERLRKTIVSEQNALVAQRASAAAELRKLAAQKAALEKSAAEVAQNLRDLRQGVIVTNEELLYQSFGLYQPTYAFASSEEYKKRLEEVRSAQKAMIKSDTAASGATSWQVNGNLAQGKKMVADTKKLLIRAFNSECDALIDGVKYSNYDAVLKRMTASRDAISKLGSIMSISITQPYFNAKVNELKLALEYQLKKQEEKEEQRRAREEMREQAKLEKEIEEERKRIAKEQTHYGNALKKIVDQLDRAQSAEEREALIQKKQEYEEQMIELEKAQKNVDYRVANQKAGYVYIISNIGAFGEGVYKIGMTRRLEPMERIDELGDASVPFSFDVHALIFCEDAPKLEAALHKAFDGRKVNMVNQRREFFRVSLEEIEAVVKQNYDKTVEFVRVPAAEQYRQSLKMASAAHPTNRVDEQRVGAPV